MGPSSERSGSREGSVSFGSFTWNPIQTPAVISRLPIASRQFLQACRRTRLSTKRPAEKLDGSPKRPSFWGFKDFDGFQFALVKLAIKPLKDHRRDVFNGRIQL